MLLTEADEDARPVLDITIARDSAEIAAASETLQRVCEENGLEKRDAIHAALAVEEIAVYAANRKSPSSHADLLVRISKGSMEIDFRCLGETFNLAADAEADPMLADSIRLLRGIAASMDHEYLLGMNSTRIIIEGRKAAVSGEERARASASPPAETKELP